MNKNHFFLYFLFAALTFVMSSCKRAGEGGKATLVLTIKHHASPIVSQPNYLDSVFVKFNTQEMPANPTQNYDMLVVGNEGTEIVRVPELKTGKYFIYATGFDQNDNARVTGGLPVKISFKERKDEIHIEVQVTE